MTVAAPILEEMIERIYGARCLKYDDMCQGCRAYRELDELIELAGGKYRPLTNSPESP